MKKTFTILIAAIAAILMMTQPGKVMGQTTYSLATSLSVNDQVIMTNIDFTKELTGVTTSGTTIGTATDINNSTPAGTYILTVVAGNNDGSIAFKTVANTYLSWSSGNSLTTASSVNDASSWTVQIVSTGDNTGNATVTNVGTTTRILSYNSGSPRFACYGNSNQQRVRFYKQVSSGPTQLTTPANFQTTSVGDQQASFSWDAVSNASSYTISYTPTGGTEQTATGLNGTSHTITGLTNGTAYTCKIKAIGDGTNYSDSEYSDEISVTPTAAQQYTVTLNANGSTSTWNVTMNGGNLPDAPAPCASWSFYGWSTSAVGSQTTTAPTCVNGTGYAPTGNITLYAVYKKTEGGGNTDGTVTLASGVYNSSTPATITWTEDYITILQEKGTSSSAVSNSYISNPRWYQNHVITMTPTSTVNSITITQYDNKYGLEDSGTSITNGSASVDNHVVTITPTNGNQAVVITMGAQARINAISVNYVGSTTYYHSTPDCTETVATPSFDVNEGTYYEPQIIIIECETAGASIYYTLNGEEPTSTESATNFLYDENEGVEISSTTTLKAKAFKTGMNPSATRTATYTIIHDVAEPTLAESQLFTTDTYSVAITVPANTTVYYTTDGTAPTNASTPYTAAFDISATTTVKAIAYDSDGCASDVVTATYTRAYTLAGAKALYDGEDVINVTISLAGVQLIAKSGSSTYMQQGTTGLMIYGSHSQDLTKGDVFTAGTVTGTITKYGENLELSISSGAFANVAKTAGTLTASATDVEITDVTGDFSTYESRYVALESLEMSVTDKTLSDGTNTLAIYDPFNVLSGAIQPDDDVIVTGVVTSYYKNPNTTYQIIPLVKSGITTCIAATLPTLDPAGGADAAHAVSTETVIVTPATSTTVTYTFGTSAYGEIDDETEITVPSTEATELEVVASRDFYTDNSASYYYMSAAASYTVNFYENGELTYYEENIVSGTSLAISSTTAPNGYEFMGWTTSEITGVQSGAPATLYNGSVTVEDNMNLYAVYALAGDANVTYTLVGAGSVTAGTYIIGALRSASTPENDYFYFADGSISSGDMNTDDNYVEIEAVAGVRQITQKPSAAQEFVFTGDNTNGFTICKVGTTDYLGYSSKANRKIAFGNTYSTYAWTVFEKTDLMANGVRLKKSTDYYIGENSTGTGSIRGYVDNTGRAIYLFKKAETPAYSNYCTRVSVPSLPLVEGELTKDYTIPTGAAYTLTSPITVPLGKTLTVPADAVFANADPANLIIEEGGQIILPEDASVSATIKRSVKGNAKAAEWEAFASTINNPAIGSTNLITGTYDLYMYDEAATGAEWRNYKANTGAFANLANSRGYLYRNAATMDITITGSLNTSDISTYTLSRNSGDANIIGFNFVGNPYQMEIYKGVAISNEYLETGYYVLENGGWVVKDDDVVIAPGAGILVQAKDGDHNKALDITYTGASAKANHDNIMFTVKNSEYSDVAYAMFDKGHGLNKIEHRNANIPMLYIPQNGERFAIAMMDDNTQMFDLSFKAKTTGKYTISMNAKGNFSYVHLIDRLTGDDTNLLIEDYSFVGSPKDNAERFIVKLSYDNDYSTGSETFAYQIGNEIIVNGEGTLEVYDVTGRKVMTTTINGVETINGLNSGVYIFRIIGETLRTQKIVVR